MPSTPSPVLKLELQAPGENENTWGDKNNNVIQQLENAVAGTTVKVITGGSVTLTDTEFTDSEARKGALHFTGALSSNATVIVPKRSKLYAVKNATSGNFTLTVKTASGSGAIVPQGETAFLYCDGTNVQAIKAPLSGLDPANTRTALGVDSMVLTKTSAYTVTAADRGKLIDATSGTWTLSLPAAASVGNGFTVMVRNSGAGVITLDPYSSQEIDGAASASLDEGASAILVCTGTAWKSIRGLPAAGGGTFLALGDTPSSYSGAAGFTVRVNSDGTGLEFVDVAAPSPSFNNRVVFTDNGTFVVPAGVNRLRLTLLGGGGAGGNAYESPWGDGGPGGTTSFGVLVSATGGGGGQSVPQNGQPVRLPRGGSAGTGTGGTIKPGSRGGDGYYYSTVGYDQAGGGGASAASLAGTSKPGGDAPLPSSIASGAGASGSNGAAGGAARVNIAGDGNPGAAGADFESGGGGGGALARSSATHFGGDGGNPGAGGGGAASAASSNVGAGGGGGSGGFVTAIVSVEPLSSHPVTVGKGGLPSSYGNYKGGKGGDGYLIVEY